VSILIRVGDGDRAGRRPSNISTMIMRPPEAAGAFAGDRQQPTTLMFAVSSSRHKNALLARERFRTAATEQGKRHDHQDDG